MKQKNRSAMIEGIEDTSFWVGRIICDTIGSAKGSADASHFKEGSEAVIRAEIAIIKAKGMVK